MDRDTVPEHPGYTYEEAAALAAKYGEEVIPAFCAMCGPQENCRVYAFRKNGKMTRVMGMAEGAANRGAICAKGAAAPQWLYAPERLTTPLIRTGARGEGKFRPVSWDEAIGVIAEKLLEQKEKYGPESLAILSPSGRDYKEISLRFLAVHGSPNHAHSGICAMQRCFGFNYTLGDRPECDFRNSDLILYWASQPVYSGPATASARELLAAKKRGAVLVAVKPSLEPDSALADIWLPIRPGTDAALALAMLHVILGEDRIDRAFVETWCYGYEHLRDHVKKYTPEWAEAITGIAAADIRRVARLYAATERACIDLGNGIEHAPSSCDAIRAVGMLMAVTGHLDRPGCNVFPTKPEGPRPRSLMRPDLYTEEMVDKLAAPEFPRAFQPFIEGPASGYYRTIETVLTGKPYPIRALIAPGTQPTVSNRGSKRVIEALRKVDFFVVADVMRTAETDYADVVVPVATPYETDHPFGFQGNRLLPHNRVVEPMGDYKSTFEFFLDLAVAMGYGADFWQGDPDAMENYRLEPFGITVDQLRAHPMGLPAGERTPPRYEKFAEVFTRKSTRLSGEPYLPQGKVALYNTAFQAAGFAPMPVWREPPESLTATPALAERYPLLLSDYHTTKNFSASWLRNVPALRAITPDPELDIHPDTARVRGIGDGDWVRVESPHGWIRVRARYYEGIRPDTVMMAHGWWQGCRALGLGDMPLGDGGANVNNLYSVAPEADDPLVTAMSSQTLVEVTKDA